MKRIPFIIGNWKMNTSLKEALELAEQLSSMPEVKKTTAQVAIAPPFTHLSLVASALHKSKVQLAAQNVHEQNSGAFTGEVSPAMLKEIGVKLAIIGHSERRQYFNETSIQCAEKIKSLLKNILTPVYCVGETLEQRKSEKHFRIVEDQISEGLFGLGAEKITKVIIAYEPVWAIGTGETASPEQAQEMHAFIRDTLSKKFGDDLAQQVIILYGGSMKPDNAAELLACTDVDGGLVGGASLKVEDFTKIIAAAQ
jgi:triosephosphate isomerase